MFYFQPNPFPEDANEELLNNQCLILLIKPRSSQSCKEDTLSSLLHITYGEMRKPPGSPDSPSQILMKIENDETNDDSTENIGVWVPDNKYTVTTLLRLFFHNIVSSYLIEPPSKTPSHYAFVFDAIQRTELKELMSKYSTEILKYGFFSNEIPEEATLIAKSIKQYEKSPERAP